MPVEKVAAAVDYTLHDALFSVSPSGPLGAPLLWGHAGGSGTLEVEMPGRLRAIMRTVPGMGATIATAKVGLSDTSAEFTLTEIVASGGGGGAGGVAVTLNPSIGTVAKGAGFP